LRRQSVLKRNICFLTSYIGVFLFDESWTVSALDTQTASSAVEQSHVDSSNTENEQHFFGKMDM
jgi:hypothetical protein